MSGLYYCEECKMVIREEDLDEQEYFLGEAWGRPIYDKEFHCPCCGEVPVEYIEPSVFDDEEIEEPKMYEPTFRREDFGF
jgi:hypothetical protein